MHRVSVVSRVRALVERRQTGAQCLTPTLVLAARMPEEGRGDAGSQAETARALPLGDADCRGEGGVHRRMVGSEFVQRARRRCRSGSQHRSGTVRRRQASESGNSLCPPNVALSSTHVATIAAKPLPKGASLL